jgi:hypothetical protein
MLYCAIHLWFSVYAIQAAPALFSGCKSFSFLGNLSFSSLLSFGSLLEVKKFRTAYGSENLDFWSGYRPVCPLPSPHHFIISFKHYTWRNG